MPDDQNTTQNPVSTENSIPASPKEPTEPAPLNTMVSESPIIPSKVPESSPSDFEVKNNKYTELPGTTKFSKVISL